MIVAPKVCRDHHIVGEAHNSHVFFSLCCLFESLDDVLVGALLGTNDKIDYKNIERRPTKRNAISLIVDHKLRF